MNNVAVIDAARLSAYALRPVRDGQSSLELAVRWARALPAVSRVAVLAGEQPLPELPAEVHSAGAGEPGALLQALRRLGEGADHIFYAFGDCPFLDSALAEKMLESHRRYFADYTFADGYPFGLSPEIVNPGILGRLETLAGDSPSAAATERSRGWLFELIQKDINAFDIETELSPVDLRMLRVSLTADTGGNFLLLERLVAAGAKEAASVCTLLQEQGQMLRTVPAFWNLQIVAGCPQLCSYCPYPVFSIKNTGKEGEMPVERVEQLAGAISGFCSEATVSVSLWGEPAYHSAFPAVADAFLSRGLSLVVETSGVGWEREALEATATLTSGAPRWIVSLDSDGPEVYRRLRGEGREQAVQTIERLTTLFPGRVYVQAVRMKENEEGLESFYRGWKERAGNVIIQKYDHFSGALPDRRVTDLAPLRRQPCWHLKRDVAVLLDGTVPLCREDIRREHVLGNLFSQPVEEVWDAAQPFYGNHLTGDYPELCKGCDEYYTFNF